ncbi:hypothetical protein HW49_08990 [Porphyromonadaceae bacterium COT-184 OH4590]|nr:hypothetical protein HW49_08990 [Porphyromonadaceae bacterium COT-184 OH4590]
MYLRAKLVIIAKISNISGDYFICSVTLHHERLERVRDLFLLSPHPEEEQPFPYRKKKEKRKNGSMGGRCEGLSHEVMYKTWIRGGKFLSYKS